MKIINKQCFDLIIFFSIPLGYIFNLTSFFSLEILYKTNKSTVLILLSGQFQSEENSKIFNTKQKHFCMIEIFKLSCCKKIKDLIILQFCLLL